MHHFDDTTIELYVLRASQVEKLRLQIESHLAKCDGCREVYTRISNFYTDVKEDLEASKNLPVLKEEGLPERIERSLKRRYSDKDTFRTIDVALPVRVGRWVVRHPYASVGGLIAFAGIALTLLLLSSKTEIKDPLPSYARAKEEFLVAYSKDGEELWRKHIGQGYDAVNLPGHVQQHPEQLLATIDVDGDGRNEIIGIFGWIPGRMGGLEQPLRNKVICYNADGSERWKYEFRRQITIGSVQYSDDYRFYLMTVADYDQDGSLEVIAAVGHTTWFPNVLVRLRAMDGSLLSEYRHNGWLPLFAHTDVDGDGIQELLFAGENSQFGRGCLAVVDPRRIEGQGPAPEGFITQEVGAGTEKYYILFPATDLEKFWTISPNKPVVLKIGTDGFIEVQVDEEVKEAGGGAIHYYFDSSLRCVKVRVSDGFASVYKRLENEGKVSRKLDEQYVEDLRKQVLYWDGERFVNTTTMNKRYQKLTKIVP